MHYLKSVTSIFYLSIFLFGCESSSLEPVIEELEPLGITKCLLVSSRTLALNPSPLVTKELFYEYDSRFNPSKETIVRNNGEVIIYTFNNEYGENDKLLSIITSRNEKYSSTKTFSYYENGKVKIELQSFPNGISYRKKEYDENGNLVVSTINATTYKSITYSVYNSNNKWIKREMEEDGEIFFLRTREYNARGLLIYEYAKDYELGNESVWNFIYNQEDKLFIKKLNSETTYYDYDNNGILIGTDKHYAFSDYWEFERYHYYTNGKLKEVLGAMDGAHYYPLNEFTYHNNGEVKNEYKYWESNGIIPIYTSWLRSEKSFNDRGQLISAITRNKEGEVLYDFRMDYECFTNFR